MAPSDPQVEVSRRYLERTMVLETTFRTATGTLRLRDCLAMREGGRDDPRRQLLRVAECTQGSVEVDCAVEVRFDYGLIPPWIRVADNGAFTAVGGSQGLVLWSDLPLGLAGRHDLRGCRTLAVGERAALSITFHQPEQLDDGPPDRCDLEQVTQRVEETEQWWQDWCDSRDGGRDGIANATLRSALVLKSLVHAPSGAIAAAATTSLPEIPGGSWNWDYRFSWIRDSWMTVHSLAEAGFFEEADGFHRFVERSSAGRGDEFQLLYGVDGRHRTPELELGELAGYRGARPVRVGNGAQEQLQLDMYGYLLNLTWQRTRQGATLDDSFWRFIVELIDTVCEKWQEPDHGIWELRGEPRHWVYSKILCWSALDRGLALASEGNRDGHVDMGRWRTARDAIRSTVESDGIDGNSGAFVETLGGSGIDASLLLVPEFGFIDASHPQMAATVDAVIDGLDDGGLIRRFAHRDQTASEGSFVACTFWLVERLVDLGRTEQARGYFERANATANDLGLFAEEYDRNADEALGNFPQALSHLSHISASLAVDRADVTNP